MSRDSFDQKYDYSYSGADCRAYAHFDGKSSDLIHLKHLSTVSLSIHEAKSPVRSLGMKSVKGFTESIRTIAGSMVLVVVKDHPLKDLVLRDSRWNMNISLDGLSSNRNKQTKISTLLNKFNMYLVYKTELGFNEKASTLIKGIRIVNESLVTSVNDMVTEVMVQFVAEEVEEFNLNEELIVSSNNTIIDSYEPQVSENQNLKTLDAKNIYDGLKDYEPYDPLDPVPPYRDYVSRDRGIEGGISTLEGYEPWNTPRYNPITPYRLTNLPYSINGESQLNPTKTTNEKGNVSLNNANILQEMITVEGILNRSKRKR